MALVAGTCVGPYEIIAPIGAGGMGEVFRVRDTRLHRDVAIKILPEFFATDADRLRRFQLEAQAAGALNHPNILAIYDIGTWEGAPYLVSELLERESLSERLKDSKLSVNRTVDYGRQIAGALPLRMRRALHTATSSPRISTSQKMGGRRFSTSELPSSPLPDQRNRPRP